MGKEQALCLHSGAKRRARRSKKPISVLKATANRQSVMITTSVADLSLSLQTPRDNKKIASAFKRSFQIERLLTRSLKLLPFFLHRRLQLWHSMLFLFRSKSRAMESLSLNRRANPIKQSYLDLEASWLLLSLNAKNDPFQTWSFLQACDVGDQAKKCSHF
jgi:hypothetical protein